ncbi:tetratricopeptide repeat protein [Actinoplanes rectilineatus]|uniref:tetratricopeptide repeat protein n=1 Tax=Actinoplanes rectilineatus TaxID=113571 RepID=UPI0005F2E8DD|nr:tetratricopeptide repeat protein [Actinoplanes rectilineatus]
MRSLPDPETAGSLDELVERLRLLKMWAGNPSYVTITERVNAAWTGAGRPAGELAGKTTVVDVFRPGRRRLNTDLVMSVVQALNPDPGYAERWRLALQAADGRARAAGLVRVQDSLPPDLAEFTGRDAELDRLREVLDGGTATVEGMAGVGKTQLALHAAHLLHHERRFDRVLVVNLRGFHPDPAQPPADPAAVLDGFLRVLGMSGPRIPAALHDRTAAFRRLLDGVRALIVLDNAADTGQVRPLLPDRPGCTVLITSRRRLTGLPGGRVTVGAFTPAEARDFLTRSAPDAAPGDDPDAAGRIAERCGRLPLALGLVSGHLRTRPAWTLTDHADRLDEHHRTGHLDSGVALALDLSYRDLAPDLQRLLRLLSLHPGQELGAHTAAALAGLDVAATRTALRRLSTDHLVLEDSVDRFTFHDLLRAYAAARSRDEDRPADRRAALTRLFDHYLAALMTAAELLFPTDAGPVPHAGEVPAMDDPKSALNWLDAERANLLAVAAYTADHGWPEHTLRMSRALYQFLNGAHNGDAVTLHEHAYRAARNQGDLAGQGHALADLAEAAQRLGRYADAAAHLRQACELFRQAGDTGGECRSLNLLGSIMERSGDFTAGEPHHRHALELARRADDLRGQARALGYLGDLHRLLGRHDPARESYHEAMALFARVGLRVGEGAALVSLGHVDVKAGRHDRAVAYFEQAIAVFRDIGNRLGEADALDGLGTVETRRGHPGRATAYHRQALDMFRESGERQLTVWALNGLGEAAQAAGRHATALDHHTEAEEIAGEIGIREQQARAHTGLGRAHQHLGDQLAAARHLRHALALYAGLPEATEVRALLDALDAGDPRSDSFGIPPSIDGSP